MNIMVNQKLKTPLGEGFVQGAYAVKDAEGTVIVKGVSVRLPINDLTREMLNQDNCLTHGAVFSGLWVFQEGECSF